MRSEVCGPEGGGATVKDVGYSSGHADDPQMGGCGGRARAAERTQNMDSMSVTLDVSKLTGWLKASAICRVESRACDARRGVRVGNRGS